jgi:hypothetical protein
MAPGTLAARCWTRYEHGDDLHDDRAAAWKLPSSSVASPARTLRAATAISIGTAMVRAAGTAAAGPQAC